MKNTFITLTVLLVCAFGLSSCTDRIAVQLPECDSTSQDSTAIYYSMPFTVNQPTKIVSGYIDERKVSEFGLYIFNTETGETLLTKDHITATSGTFYINKAKAVKTVVWALANYPQTYHPLNTSSLSAFLESVYSIYDWAYFAQDTLPMFFVSTSGINLVTSPAINIRLSRMLNKVVLDQITFSGSTKNSYDIRALYLIDMMPSTTLRNLYKEIPSVNFPPTGKDMLYFQNGNYIYSCADNLCYEGSHDEIDRREYFGTKLSSVTYVEGDVMNSLTDRAFYFIPNFLNTTNYPNLATKLVVEMRVTTAKGEIMDCYYPVVLRSRRFPGMYYGEEYHVSMTVTGAGFLSPDPFVDKTDFLPTVNYQYEISLTPWRSVDISELI